MSDYTPADVAKVLGVPRKWVIQNLPALPHYRLSKNVIRFTDDDLEAIRGLGRNEPPAADPAGLTDRSRRSA